ncbi:MULTISPECIES: SDR family NAD(P)-dependent oxidoreductase [Parabacteroides]|jgi:NAD(P)-dependent dehydrogenase (short-subunit alcohol dehydrogenase family)|uniref:SDR family NAD(P)-dependent oxidoreductase n=1 Tax=Parabacteroides TaxID=375288 RepID=UPI0018A96EB3|nr:MULTISPECIES: SDR family oxidoreductase [Parabacteroides]MDB9024254.1 SDR family NAD(P)-dependent oxidoreductase [Parabacteroides distasonis]MDB9042560.1 SDR family NAD(P)-dependent oxidoreductase [Parabacteroides distasonis]MDB9093565.1 SDR family NAD(P)-dependent oxidoreductase [Parabacteroides distasonis]MDB9159067.1 SDR family NAD(P)-dependent oxidoreductase [Parabacteroides distasonis]MDO5429492.1 SDR family oxidoreductase [Parabacteroides sp.]
MNSNPFSLTGKTILITGASSGIGKASAIQCSAMGANVIITARDEQRLNQTFCSLDISKQNISIIADLTNKEDIDRLICELPIIDGVMLCAGKSKRLPIQFITRESLDDLFNINFYAPVELLRLLYKKKKISKGGSVVLVDSIGGNTVFAPGAAMYGSSKAALNAMMRYCAKEFASRLIRVNCICPGMVDTPLIHRGDITAEQLEKDKDQYPLKRYGTPEDIAYSAVYLLSDASSWLTGQDIIIDGGISIN